MVFNEEGKDFRECVECGYKDEMRFQQHVRELDTRVNVTESARKEETQVLKFPPLEDSSPQTGAEAASSTDDSKSKE